ncbi:conserved Plasmodium protein, unknown function [Plasmodium yoelii]|nr:conserved Plasmodium protein, unknown function [Plasmodium yoelii]CDU20946.1 conserved Plasmodium protein, unknown function [Plasmodium yoelii]VTZ81912.1 conserved Plasmodium protein, unknown function [Plasmodium yoelii]|eukprot:XP_727057.2 conserved Plasmodium protein, unknown function [Plasmodium yoelii]
MKRNLLFFIYYHAAIFMVFWKFGNGKGGNEKKKNVKDLIRRYESINNSNDLNNSSSSSSDLTDTNYEDRDNAPNRRQNVAFDDQQPSTSYANRNNGNQYGRMNMKGNANNDGNNMINDEDYDDDDDSDSEEFNYQEPSNNYRGNNNYMHNSNSQTPMYANKSYLYSSNFRDPNENQPSENYDDQYSPQNNPPYLGRSFDNFRNRLGLNTEDFSRGTETYSNTTNKRNTGLNNDSDSFITDDIQYTKYESSENPINSSRQRHDSGMRQSPNNEYNDRNNNSNNRNSNMYINTDEDDDSYSNPYGYNNQNQGPNASQVMRYRLNSDDDSIDQQSIYSNPIDDISTSDNYSLNFGGKKKSRSIQHIENDNSSILNSQRNYEDIDNNSSRNGDNRSKIQNKPSIRIFDRGNKGDAQNKSKRLSYSNSNPILNKNYEPRQPITRNSTSNKILASYIDIYTAQQRNIFYNKNTRVEKSPIKKFFKMNNSNDKIISVTEELLNSSKQCIVNNINKLTNDVLLKNLALNNTNMIKNYEQAVSYIVFHSKIKNKESHLDIKSVPYKYSELHVENSSTILPNMYILNTYEFMLSNQRICGRFRTIIKNKKRDNNLKPVDLVLMLSLDYIKNMNPTLVSNLIKFIKTKQSIYMKKYYFNTMVALIPFIKPALKIYYGESIYKDLTTYKMQSEIKNIFDELLLISIKWAQAFKDKYSANDNKIILDMHQTISKFSTSKTRTLSKTFVSLENILYKELITNDIVDNKDDNQKVLISYIVKCFRNIYYSAFYLMGNKRTY